LVLAGEPRLAYQPVVDLATGRLLGFEALLRWLHPSEGVIPPRLVIPWAEANGDIVALGDWVLSEGCRQATAWPPSVQLAVNCSLVQLRRGVASPAVEAALEESGLEPDRLTIEVTEHAMSEEPAIAELRRIAAFGVQLAVDDVGTSWNSFELLRRMAINTIKIDDSFVNGLEIREGINRMVVETVVHLAHNCGMSTVAEGVETAVHVAIVREFDSDAAQGYFFSPPMDGENAAKLANVPDLTFPLEGPGWMEGDDWPFPGASAESTAAVYGQSARPARRGAAASLGAAPEVDGIDVVDLILEQPHEAPASAPDGQANEQDERVDRGATGRSKQPPASNGSESPRVRSSGRKASRRAKDPTADAPPRRAKTGAAKKSPPLADPAEDSTPPAAGSPAKGQEPRRRPARRDDPAT
jgi:EAL domain-containing protein (putative c-di-GMP-specific phosphodiesterase class I)